MSDRVTFRAPCPECGRIVRWVATPGVANHGPNYEITHRCTEETQ